MLSIKGHNFQFIQYLTGAFINAFSFLTKGKTQHTLFFFWLVYFKQIIPYRLFECVKDSSDIPARDKAYSLTCKGTPEGHLHDIGIAYL